MREQILVSAQRLVQQRGFNGFSYADIADEVGIRKASLHHHFPTKTDLGLALIDAYTTQLQSGLRHIGESFNNPADQLRAYVAIYRGSLDAGRMCMGGMLASDALTIDPVMLPGLKGFFACNIEWLTEVLAVGNSQRIFALSGSASDHARMLLAALQGALLIARTTEDIEAFERTTSLLITDILRKG